MVRKLIIILLLLVGCTPKVEPIELNQAITIDYYYINDCSDCKAFKKNVIPYLEAVFEDNITINQYDLDDENTIVPYDEDIDALVDFDEEFYGTGPFIVVNGYFAILGYTGGDEEYLIQDIVSATKNEPYCDELEGIRFHF